MATNIAAEGHNDNLFEERDRCTAHFDHTWIEAAWAGRRERHEFLLDVACLMLICFIVNRLAEVNHVCINLRLLFLISCSGRISHSESLLFCLFIDGLHLLEKSFLLCCRRLHSLSLALRSCSKSLTFRLGFFLESILFGIPSRFIDIVPHGLVILNRAQESLMDAGDIWIWRVWVLDKAVA